MCFYRFMKLETIFFCIIKAAKVCKLIIAVIWKACIFCYLVAFCNKFVNKFIQLVFILQPPFMNFSIYFFPQFTVWIF